MAALTEEDLKKILGDNFRELERQAQEKHGVDDEYRDTMQSISSYEDKVFSSVASLIVGIALVFSAYKTQPVGSTGFIIQLVIAALFVAIGIFGYLRCKQRISSLREVAARLTANRKPAQA